jgi:hypothetical protein
MAKGETRKRYPVFKKMSNRMDERKRNYSQTMQRLPHILPQPTPIWQLSFCFPKIQIHLTRFAIAVQEPFTPPQTSDHYEVNFNLVLTIMKLGS